MFASSMLVLRNAAMGPFAFPFNGLGESYITSLLTEEFHVQGSASFAHVSVWKVRTASQEQLTAYYSNTGAPSPLSMFHRLQRLRSYLPLFFALPGYPMEPFSGAPNEPLNLLLDTLQIPSTTEVKYTSHSIR